MKFLLLLVGFAIVNSASVNDINKETFEHGADHNPIDEDHMTGGEHNPEYDHEAILGSRGLNEEFEKLEPEVAKTRLRALTKKIDKDQDGFVTKPELMEWVMNSFRLLDEEEAAKRLKEFDLDTDNTLEWEEYVAKAFGYKPEDIKEWENDPNKEMADFLELLEMEKHKFTIADSDKNDRLDAKEFSAFMHPYDYEFMHDFEVNRTLFDFDKDKDGFISFTEYLGNPETMNEQQQVTEKENFQIYDIDKDNKLNKEEVRKWAIPDYTSLANDEASHLISESDEDKDEKLSIDEIVNKHELWVGSQATDFGRHLRHDPEEL